MWPWKLYFFLLVGTEFLETLKREVLLQNRAEEEEAPTVSRGTGRNPDAHMGHLER